MSIGIHYDYFARGPLLQLPHPRFNTLPLLEGVNTVACIAVLSTVSYNVFNREKYILSLDIVLDEPPKIYLDLF